MNPQTKPTSIQSIKTIPISEPTDEEFEFYLAEHKLFKELSKGKVVDPLALQKATNLQKIVDEGGFLDVTCDYCNTEYHIGAQQLRTLLHKS